MARGLSARKSGAFGAPRRTTAWCSTAEGCGCEVARLARAARPAWKQRLGEHPPSHGDGLQEEADLQHLWPRARAYLLDLRREPAAFARRAAPAGGRGSPLPLVRRAIARTTASSEPILERDPSADKHQASLGEVRCRRRYALHQQLPPTAPSLDWSHTGFVHSGHPPHRFCSLGPPARR